MQMEYTIQNTKYKIQAKRRNQGVKYTMFIKIGMGGVMSRGQRTYFENNKQLVGAKSGGDSFFTMVGKVIEASIDVDDHSGLTHPYDDDTTNTIIRVNTSSFHKFTLLQM